MFLTKVDNLRGFSHYTAFCSVLHLFVKNVPDPGVSPMVEERMCPVLAVFSAVLCSKR